MSASALVRDLAEPAVLTQEAEAFERAARCLLHSALPDDAAEARGYQVAYMRLMEQARARRELVATMEARQWSA